MLFRLCYSIVALIRFVMADMAVVNSIVCRLRNNNSIPNIGNTHTINQ